MPSWTGTAVYPPSGSRQTPDGQCLQNPNIPRGTALAVPLFLGGTKLNTHASVDITPCGKRYYCLFCIPEAGMLFLRVPRENGEQGEKGHTHDSVDNDEREKSQKIKGLHGGVQEKSAENISKTPVYPLAILRRMCIMMDAVCKG